MSQPRKIIAVFALLVTCCVFNALGCNESITCKGGAFLEGNPGKIECFFHENILQKHRNFNVMHFIGQTKSVASCIYDISMEDVRCSKPDGYVVDIKKATNSVSLFIEKMSEKNIGEYACQIVPNPKNRNCTRCNVTLLAEQPPEIPKPVPAKELGISAPVCQTSCICQEQSAGYLFIIINIIIVVMFSIVLIVLYIKFQGRIKQIFSSHAGNDNETQNLNA